MCYHQLHLHFRPLSENSVPVQDLFVAFWSHANICKHVSSPSDSNQELKQTWLTDLLTCGVLFPTALSQRGVTLGHKHNSTGHCELVELDDFRGF